MLIITEKLKTIIIPKEIKSTLRNLFLKVFYRIQILKKYFRLDVIINLQILPFLHNPKLSNKPPCCLNFFAAIISAFSIAISSFDLGV